LLFEGGGSPLNAELSGERINKSEREALAIHRSLVDFSVR
jgi:hypothetical protein